jgi:site-specific recombinase XerD
MALGDAVEWGLIPVNPARKVKVSGATPTKNLRIPSADEMAQFVRANRDTRWHPLWAWFTVTGSRLREALALRWIDIDWDHQETTIWQSVSGDAAKRVIKTPKTTSGARTIALGPRIVVILRAHQKAQQDLRALAGSEWEESRLVFTTFQGKIMSKRNVEREFKKALTRADLPLAIRIHDLRHGTATCWLAKGVNPKVVTKRLGHSDGAFTLQVYGHVLPGEEAPIAAKILSENGEGRPQRLSKTSGQDVALRGAGYPQNRITTPLSRAIHDNARLPILYRPTLNQRVHGASPCSPTIRNHYTASDCGFLIVNYSSKTLPSAHQRKREHFAGYSRKKYRSPRGASVDGKVVGTVDAAAARTSPSKIKSRSQRRETVGRTLDIADQNLQDTW